MSFQLNLIMPFVIIHRHIQVVHVCLADIHNIITDNVYYFNYHAVLWESYNYFHLNIELPSHDMCMPLTLLSLLVNTFIKVQCYIYVIQFSNFCILCPSRCLPSQISPRWHCGPVTLVHIIRTSSRQLHFQG